MEVLIIFGSISDKDVMQAGAKILKEFGISYQASVCSAHRAPEKLDEILQDSLKSGVKCIIAGAGLAAHLPGVIASKVSVPVIGVPINANLLGQDALYSIVQMPKGVPVATVGINNSTNAALLAIEILALGNKELKEKLEKYREEMKKSFINHSVEL